MAERAVRTADAIVVPSVATARALADHLELQRQPDVVPLGVTALPSPPDADRRLERLGLSAGGYVLSLATLEPRKGLDVLIRAMAHPAAPDLALVLVGASGWGGVDPQAVASDVGLTPGRVRTLGRLGDTDLAAVLGAASVLAVPSRAEGFGLPVLEGMAAGVPVVTSRDPALLEVGGDATLTSGTGDAAALAEALRQVCDEHQLRASLVSAGRIRAASYTWRQTAEQHLAVYRRLL
jgi:glycosyltransferase involved in cell wall biosynthesis